MSPMSGALPIFVDSSKVQKEWNDKIKDWTDEMFPGTERHGNMTSRNILVPSSILEIIESLLGRRVPASQTATQGQLKAIFGEITENVKHLLSRTEEPITTVIQKSNIKEFSKAVEPYITKSSMMNQCHDDKKVQSWWPLVNKCSMYHKWEVLKDGIVLIDLPGLHDANFVRGRIAREYLEECQAICLLLDGLSAFDDRDANNLASQLHADLRRSLELDGKLNMLSFVVTKTDLYQPEELAKEEGKLDEWRIANEAYQNTKKKIGDLVESMQEITRAGQVNQQQLIAWLEVKIKLTEKGDAEKKQVEEIEMDCLHSLNERRVAQIQEMHRAQTDEGDQLAPHGLQVFCISATEALQLQKFRTIQDTGILKLREHLQKYARYEKMKLLQRGLGLVVRRSDSLVTLLKVFVKLGETSRDSKASMESLDLVKELVQTELKEWVEELLAEIKNHDVISDLKEGAEQAKSHAVETQTKWRHIIKWNTYQAVMRRQGIFDDIDMNHSLVVPILDAMTASWKELFINTLLPSLSERLRGKFKDRLSEWEWNQKKQRVQGIEEDSEVEEAMAFYLTSSFLLVIDEKTTTWHSMIKEIQRQGWRKIGKHIQTDLLNGYSRAANESGRGMFDRMHNIMIDEVRFKKEAMFEEAIREVQTELLRLVTQLENQVYKALNELSVRIKRELGVNMNTINCHRCASIAIKLCYRAQRILKLDQLAGLEPHNEENYRRLEDAVTTLRSHLSAEELMELEHEEAMQHDEEIMSEDVRSERWVRVM